MTAFAKCSCLYADDDDDDAAAVGEYVSGLSLEASSCLFVKEPCSPSILFSVESEPKTDGTEVARFSLAEDSLLSRSIRSLLRPLFSCFPGVEGVGVAFVIFSKSEVVEDKGSIKFLAGCALVQVREQTAPKLGKLSV